MPPVARAAAAIILVAGLSGLVLLIPIEYEAMAGYGYPGVFIVTLVTTGSFVLPVPYLVVILKAGTILNPVAVALTAGAAAAIGELSGYLLGYSTGDLVGSSRWQVATSRWLKRYGFPAVAFLAFIPNPVFDAAGVAAGALRYPVWRFALACFIGKTAKFLLVAGLGFGFTSGG